MNFEWRFAVTGPARFWILSLLFITVSVIFGVIAPAMTVEDASRYTGHTSGTVIRHVERDEGYLYPVLEFSTAGKTFTVESREGSKPASHRAGDRVEVSFDPQNPADFRIADNTALQSLPLIFRFIGVIFFMIGFPILCMTIISVVIAVTSKDNIETWYWWINFVGGIMGALSFALPSAFIYPLFFLVPSHIRDTMKNPHIILPVFTILGIIVGVLVFLVGRSQFRSRPRWKKT